MSYYEKFISYIDLFEQEEKIKNIGFVKSEIRDNTWKVKVNIRGLQKTDTIMCEMKTAGSEVFLDRFQIVKGEGQFETIYEMNDLEKRGHPYHSVQGLIFQIAGHRYGKCIWKHGLEKPKVRTEERCRENIAENEKEVRKEVKIHKEEIHMALAEYGGIQLSGDKWKQLGRMYPAIHPFHEKEKGEYISIKPKDFVVLYGKFQTLVNNSFLLHGYFNYRHIILGRRTAEGKVRYVIGVPGVFYEREKMVAVMFGFEEFEGVDSEKTGAFGYYMREVQI